MGSGVEDLAVEGVRLAVKEGRNVGPGARGAQLRHGLASLPLLGKDLTKPHHLQKVVGAREKSARPCPKPRSGVMGSAKVDGKHAERPSVGPAQCVGAACGGGGGGGE